MAYRNPILRDVAQRESDAATEEMEEADERLLRALRAVHSPFSQKNSGAGTPTAVANSRTVLPPIQSKSSIGRDGVTDNPSLSAVSTDTGASADTSQSLATTNVKSIEHKLELEARGEPNESAHTEPEAELESKSKLELQAGSPSHDSTIDIPSLEVSSKPQVLPTQSSPYIMKIEGPASDTVRNNKPAKEEDDDAWHPISKLPKWSITKPSTPQFGPNERCPVCTLPMSKCQCIKSKSKDSEDTFGFSTTLKHTHRPLGKHVQAIGMGRRTDSICKIIHAFDPDDEARRGLTLSPQLTVLLWLRALCRAAATSLVSLHLDAMPSSMIVQWWWLCPSTLMSDTVPTLRPVVAFSYELAIMLLVLLQFNRQMRGYLRLRPLIGLIASSIVVVDIVGILVFCLSRPEQGSLSILEDWMTSSIQSGAALVFLGMTLLIDVASWSTAAYWVLAHDRSQDGDMDGTDTVGEISGEGAAGTGISTYRLAQLVHLRAGVWSSAAAPPSTPVPLRVYLHLVGGVFASTIGCIIFASFGLPAIQEVRNVQADIIRSMGKSNATGSYNHENSTIHKTTESLDTSDESLSKDMLWDPRLVIGISIGVSFLGNISRLIMQRKLFLENLHLLRKGKIPLRSNHNPDEPWYVRAQQVFGSSAASGLLGFHAGWHLGMQVLMSTSICVFLEIVSMAHQIYSETVSVEHSMQEIPTDDDGNSQSNFSVPVGVIELVSFCFISIAVLLSFERYIIGVDRCLRPRHLLGCYEICSSVLQGAYGFLLGIFWMIQLLVSHNLFMAPFLVQLPALLKNILIEAARNYERHNNPVLRVSCALFRRIVGGNIAWDNDYRSEEESMNAQENATNAALRLFWLCVECPSLIPELEDSEDEPWDIVQARRVLKSFPDRLTKEQIQMLRVAFSQLDADEDGKVGLQDMYCATAVIPELYDLNYEELARVIAKIGLSLRDWREVKRMGSVTSSKPNQFNFKEYLCFLRHRLFLCDMHHHGEGANEVLGFGIELRRLRGQLEGAIRLQLQQRSSSPNKYTRPQSADQRQKRDSRLANRAIELSKEISEMEMAFWGSKMPPHEFHLLLPRIQSGYTRTKGSESAKSEDLLNFQPELLRRVILVCLGPNVDSVLGELVLDALKGGQHGFANEKSLRASYLLSHSTGWRLGHIGREVESIKERMDGLANSNVNVLDPNQFSSVRSAARQAVRNSIGTDDYESDHGNESDEEDNNESYDENKDRVRMHVEVNRRLSPKHRLRSPKAGLGAEKQMLSFVSRGLLPHVHSEDYD